MPLEDIAWNGDLVIGQRFKIRNVSDNDIAKINHIYLDNINNYLLSNTNNQLPQGFVFYHEYYPFKFFNAPIKTPGVTTENINTIEIIPDILSIEQNPGFSFYSGYPNPFSISTSEIGAPLYETQYISGPGISVEDVSITNPGTVKLFNYNLRDLYRAPEIYNLPPYDLLGDELEICIIFTPNNQFRGEYTSELIIKYSDGNGILNKVHKNTIVCTLTNSNFSEVDKTLNENIFSIDNVQIESQMINLF
tara:strand:- start:273 stop:1019 length:747 start_codon:yes stop_codon:yes gene_type:complete